MVVLSYFVAALVATTQSAAIAPSQVVSALKSLGLSAETDIIDPSNDEYASDFTQRWTTHDMPSYAAAVKPTLERDVATIIKFASNNSIPFLATGAGHGFSTHLGRIQDGIEIDLGAFNHVSVDVDASTMTIGGSVRFGDIFEPLGKAGKEIQTGSDKCVGMVGATLGGGVGRYNGLHGMMVDALKSVRLVTASGQVVTASESENSDLFWGIRGAGSNFGIVLSATYDVYDQTNHGQVVNADFLFPLNGTSAVLNYFKSFEENQPAELSIIMQMGFSPQYGGTYLAVNVAFAGSMEKGRQLVQPLVNAHPMMHNITTVPWKDLTYNAFFGTAPKGAPCAKNALHNVYGAGIKTYDIPTFQRFMSSLNSFYAAHPTAQNTVFFIEAFPLQAVQRVPVDATAYPHRDILAHLLFTYTYTDLALEGTVNSFAQKARAQFAETSGLDGLQVYSSYAHGDEGPVPLYGSRNLGRLRQLKQKWDPRGVFSYNEPFN
ncbi:hypothetical protein FE257_008146 [Aspergillus nanangensis]|uniref:FAD-binding PCMH-type domain-containing protein n=1 Tax=Aspergillus nanangensis TaxID=2582783 RepID=A0AAD4CM61_ASPNN|nr:hypothetical protein FE257_008146 [Aspergillus nanangensis]